jgi:hypothetical protein
MVLLVLPVVASVTLLLVPVAVSMRLLVSTTVPVVALVPTAVLVGHGVSVRCRWRTTVRRR